jgi:glycosyltransferase involved in cell wall biosynthesis
MPRFTVIIPTYNRGHRIDETIRSVLNQSFSDWDCIVVDDGSVDCTHGVVQSAASNDRRIKYLYQPNAGVSAARNRGMAHSESEWVAFLDSDDAYLPNALSTFEAAIAVHPLCKAVCGRVLDESRFPVKCSNQISSRDCFWSMLGFVTGRPSLTMQSSCVHRSALSLLEGFSSAYGTAEDWHFGVRLSAVTPIVEADLAIACYRSAHGEGKSERSLISGTKSETHRRIIQNLCEDPLVLARVSQSEDAARFHRLSQAHLAVVDAEGILREGNMLIAMEHLIRAVELCRDEEELEAVLRRLVYYLYYPQSSPSMAGLQSAQSLARLSRAAQHLHAGELANSLLVRASDARFRGARESYELGHRRHAWGLVLRSLLAHDPIRSLRSAVRFVQTCVRAADSGVPASR